MTASHGWRLLNTFYRYQVNLVRVWRGWEVPIISFSMSPVRNPLKILRPSPLLLEDGMVWCGGIMTASHGWRLLNTFYRYEVNLVRVWSGWAVLIISYSMSPRRNPLKILRLCPVPTASEWWYGMVLWHYDCQPWLKAFKHFLYVWSESGMSMKWMGGPNHILQHVPKEKPTENLSSTCRMSACRFFAQTATFCVVSATCRRHVSVMSATCPDVVSARVSKTTRHVGCSRHVG